MIPPLTFFMLLPDNDFDDFGSLDTFVRFEAVLVLDLVAIKFSFLSLVLVIPDHATSLHYVAQKLM